MSACEIYQCFLEQLQFQTVKKIVAWLSAAFGACPYVTANILADSDIKAQVCRVQRLALGRLQSTSM